MKFNYRVRREDKVESLKLGVLWLIGSIIPCIYPAQVLLNRSAFSSSGTEVNFLDQFDVLTIVIILFWSSSYFILGISRLINSSKVHNSFPLFVPGWIIGSAPLFGFVISFTL